MTRDSDPFKDPRDAAAHWFARVRSGRMDEAEQARFERWREADALHEQEYRRALGIWNATSLIPADRLRALAANPSSRERPFLLRRRQVLGLAVGAAAAGVAAVMLTPFVGPPDLTNTYSTAQGERRQVSLPDASLIDLNTNTVLTVRFERGRRVVELASGEAFFTVTRDASRPFYVRAGDAEVRVTGTRFDVRRENLQRRVAVESGSVEVRQGPWWDRRRMRLEAGQAVSLGERGPVPLAQDDVGLMFSWRQGRLVFQDAPLSDAVAEINRYASRPIRINEASLGRLRIAGVFSIENPQAFLELLPSIAPVRIRVDADGTPVIIRP